MVCLKISIMSKGVVKKRRHTSILGDIKASPGDHSHWLVAAKQPRERAAFAVADQPSYQQSYDSNATGRQQKSVKQVSVERREG